MKNAPIATLALAAALSACSGGKEPVGAESGGEAAVSGESGEGSPTAASHQGEADKNGLPAALQGRWGLVPADCTSIKGDAKGLLTVSADRLTFYESVAKLDTVKDRQPYRVTATFDFTGEGQSWALDVTLSSPDGGKTLVRKDTGPDAAPEPLVYTKCPA